LALVSPRRVSAFRVSACARTQFTTARPSRSPSRALWPRSRRRRCLTSPPPWPHHACVARVCARWRSRLGLCPSSQPSPRPRLARSRARRSAPQPESLVSTLTCPGSAPPPLPPEDLAAVAARKTSSPPSYFALPRHGDHTELSHSRSHEPQLIPPPLTRGTALSAREGDRPAGPELSAR